MALSASFRAALRIARRDAWRNKGRSLLVIALIGLPVLVLSAVDVGWRTYQLSPAQRLTREIGAADLAVRSAGSATDAVQQTPQGWLDHSVGYATAPSTDHASEIPEPASDEAALRTMLPAGSRVISYIERESLTIRTKDGVEYAPLVGFDYADPIAKGKVKQLSGRAPRTADEIAITSKLSTRTGFKVGDTLTTYDKKSSYTVVGIVDSIYGRRDSGAYVIPSAVEGVSPGQRTWLVDTPGPFTWQQVLQLNKIGFVAISRQAYLHPPPKSQVPYYSLAPNSGGNTVSTSAVATITLVAGMALLEVVLLAGPAFAVSARRQRRDLALMAATGGRPGHLRNVVLANGVVLGLAAGVIGAVLGTGITGAAMGLFGGLIGQIPGPFDIRPLELGGVALVSLLTAVLAALVPARAAAKTDVVAALAGRRGQAAIKRRVPIIGTAVILIGILVALAGGSATRSINLLLAGIVITEFGLIICTPTLITLLAKLGRWLPFAPRLALRDATRNRSSAAPAVAAVMASVIGAIAIAIIATSQTDLDRRSYEPAMATNAAWVNDDYYGPGTPAADATDDAAVTSALRTALDTTSVSPVYRLGEPACLYDPTPSGPCSSANVSLEDPTATSRGELTGTRYRNSIFNNVVVDGGSAVSTLFGTPEPAAEAALRAGKVVVSDSAQLKNGMLTFWILTSTWDPTQPNAASGDPVKEMTVPAVAVDDGFAAAQAILPPALARSIAGEPVLEGWVAGLARRPTTKERQAVNKALVDIAPELQVRTEDGFRTSSEWALFALVGAAGLIALGAAAIATMLANVDGRADLVTLGAIGASPRTRRVVSMGRAGVIAGIGCVIGTAAGFVPAIAWIKRQALPG